MFSLSGQALSPMMAQYLQQMQMQGIPAPTQTMGAPAQQQPVQPNMTPPLQGAPAASQSPTIAGQMMTGAPQSAPMQGMIQPQRPMGAPGMPMTPSAPQGAPQQQPGGMMSQLFQNPQMAATIASQLKTAMNPNAAGNLASSVGPAAGAPSTAALVAHQGGGAGMMSDVGSWLSLLRNGLGSGIGG